MSEATEQHMWGRIYLVLGAFATIVTVYELMPPDTAYLAGVLGAILTTWLYIEAYIRFMRYKNLSKGVCIHCGTAAR